MRGERRGEEIKIKIKIGRLKCWRRETRTRALGGQIVNGVDISPRVPIGRIPARVGSRGSMSRALLQQVRWTIIVTRVLLWRANEGGADNGRPELGTILPTLFLSFFFAVDLLPPPRMEIHFIKLDAKFDIFSFVMWRVTLIVRFLRNFSLINDKSDVQHKFRTYQSVNIYLFQAYSLKHFSKRNIRKISKIDYILISRKNYSFWKIFQKIGEITRMEYRGSLAPVS